MSVTRRNRVPMPKQIRLINECHQSVMTDADWCSEKGIAVSIFYNWVSRCRKAAADQILLPNYGNLETPCPRQDVVSIDIVPHSFSEQHASAKIQKTYLDNSHTIEIAVKDITIRIRNDAEPTLLTRTFQMLLESLG